MEANGYTYVPVAEDGTPDSTTTIVHDLNGNGGNSRVTKINARLVTGLFQGGPSDIVIISGTGALEFASRGRRSANADVTKEFVAYVGTYSDDDGGGDASAIAMLMSLLN